MPIIILLDKKTAEPYLHRAMVGGGRRHPLPRVVFLLYDKQAN